MPQTPTGGPYRRFDAPADMPPVRCVTCGRRFVPTHGALYMARRSGRPLATYPWCCSPRCNGHRGGKARQERRP